MFFEKVRAFFQWLGEKSMAKSRKSLDYKWTTYRAEKDEASANPMSAKSEAEASAAIEAPQAPTVAIDVDALFTGEKKEAGESKKAASRRKTTAKSAKSAAEKSVKTTKTVRKAAPKAEKPATAVDSAGGDAGQSGVKKSASKKPARRTAVKKTAIETEAPRAGGASVLEKLPAPEAPVLLEAPQDTAAPMSAAEPTAEIKPAAKKTVRRRSAVKKAETSEPSADADGEKKTAAASAKKPATRRKIEKKNADAVKAVPAADAAKEKPAAKRTRSGAAGAKKSVLKKESASEDAEPGPAPHKKSRSKQVPPEEKLLFEKWREMIHDRNLQGLISRLKERFPEVADLTTKPQLVAHMKANRDLAKAVTDMIGVTYRNGATRPGRKPRRRLVLSAAPQEAAAPQSAESDDTQK